MNLVVKDASRQIIGRVGSALVGFLVLKIISPYLGALRYGDYSTIIAYFAIWSALADFGVYVIGLKHLGKIKNNTELGEKEKKQQLSTYYSKFFSTRVMMIGVVYLIALAVAYLIPSYQSNPYLLRALPLGMLYSAFFMLAGIIQTPLQLYRKMEQVSIGLLLARAAQMILIVLTVYIRYADITFSSYTGAPLVAFILIIASLVVSALVQGWYVYTKAKTYIQLRRIRDRAFTRELLLSNRQYGVAYYLSSFHTLIVTILLSIFFATSKGFDYAGTRGLALQLITILLIVPSALGNSIIHKVADTSLQEKKQNFGALLHFVLWIGVMVVIGFSGFSKHIINFIGGSDYLSTGSTRGSDALLPFLGIVLTLSFVKQVFNYLFVSTNLQNKLLSINLLGVIVGCIVGIPLVRYYNLVGGLIMQVLLEVCFLSGAIRIAWKEGVLPHISRASILSLVIGGGSLSYLLHQRGMGLAIGGWQWLMYGGGIATILCIISFPRLKKVMKQL